MGLCLVSMMAERKVACLDQRKDVYLDELMV